MKTSEQFSELGHQLGHQLAAYRAAVVASVSCPACRVAAGHACEHQPVDVLAARPKLTHVHDARSMAHYHELVAGLANLDSAPRTTPDTPDPQEDVT